MSYAQDPGPSTSQGPGTPTSQDTLQNTGPSTSQGTGIPTSQGQVTPTSQGPMAPIVKKDDRLTFLLARTIESGTPLMKEIYNQATGPRNPGESLEELILRITGMSKEEFEDKFNPEMRDLLDRDPCMDSFDITALFTLLQHGCCSFAPVNGQAWFTSGTLENNLKRIKDIRNDLIHSVISMSDDQFYKQLEKQRKLLIETALLAQSRFSLDEETVNAIISRCHSKINVARDIPFETNYFESLDITPLINSLKSEGIPELKEVLRGSSIVNPASLITGRNLPMEVDEIFTPLKIVGERGGGNTDDTVNLEDVLAVAYKKKKNIIILEGIAGVGKTTITKKIISDVSKGKDSTMKKGSDFDFVFPMQCRDSGYKSVGRIASDLMPTARKKFREDKHMTTCLVACKNFFILDGVDEMTDDSKCVLKELLEIEKEESERQKRQKKEEAEKKKREKEEKKKREEEKKKKQKEENKKEDKDEEKEEGKEEQVEEKKEEKLKFMLLLTTRPEKVHEIYQMIPTGDSNVLHLRVDGVVENHRDDFITKYHTKLKDLGVSTQCDANGLLTYLRTTGARLQDQWTLPLNLTLLTLLWGIDDDRILNVTCPIELLIAIRDISRVRLEERVIHKISYTLKIFDKKMKVFYSILYEIALFGIRDSELLIPECQIQKLRQICDIANLPIEELIGAFMVQKLSWTSDDVFTFPQKSTQEYFAANHIYNRVFDKQLNKQRIEDKLEKVISLLTRHGAASAASQEVSEFLKEETAKGRTITQVITKVNQEVSNPPPVDTYQNTLTSLLGIQHYNKGTIQQNSADEMVKLLEEAGVKGRRQWISVLNKVKCDPVVAKTIIRTVPDIMENQYGYTHINDQDVFAYATLLEHKKPKEVKIRIKQEPRIIPRLEELFGRFLQDNIPIDDLILEYLIVRESTDTPFRSCLNKLLQKCKIKGWYEGPLPCVQVGRDQPLVVEGLRETKYLCIPVWDAKDCENFFGFLDWKETTRKSPHGIPAPPLELLDMTIGKNVHCSDVQRISSRDVRDGDGIEVYFPDVSDTTEDHQRVASILKSLFQRKIGSLFFPRYQMNPSPASPGIPRGGGGGGGGGAIKRLLSSLGGIRVTYAVSFPCRMVPSDEAEREEIEMEAKRILGVAYFKWGGYGRGIYNFDWE